MGTQWPTHPTTRRKRDHLPSPWLILIVHSYDAKRTRVLNRKLELKLHCNTIGKELGLLPSYDITAAGERVSSPFSCKFSSRARAQKYRKSSQEDLAREETGKLDKRASRCTAC